MAHSQKLRTTLDALADEARWLLNEMRYGSAFDVPHRAQQLAQCVAEAEAIREKAHVEVLQQIVACFGTVVKMAGAFADLKQQVASLSERVATLERDRSAT